MADYQPLIARAVAGLEKNTGEARRALYERARTALVAQLRGIVPALDESEITRERLALEEAIRKVEAETARRSRFDQPKPEPKPSPAEPESPSLSPSRNPIHAEPAPQTQRPSRSRRARAPWRGQPPSPARLRRRRAASTAQIRPALRARRGASRRPPACRRFRRPAPSGRSARAGRGARTPPQPADGGAAVTDRQGPQGLPRCHGRTAAAGAGGERFRAACRPYRAGAAGTDRRSRSVDPPEPVRSRPEPSATRWSLSARGRTFCGRRPSRDRMPREAPPVPARDRMPRAAPSAPAPDRSIEFSAQDMPDYSVVPRPRPPPAAPARRGATRGRRAVARPPRSYRGLVRLLVVAAVLAAFAGAGAVIYTYPGTILAWVNPFKGAGTPVQTRDVTATRTNKIPDRVVGPGVPESARPGSVAGPAVAQRVVLYEDDPGDPQGKQYVGSAIWRTELVSPGPGLAPELAVRADVEIPERRITMAWSIRRNTDQNLPASHTIEIMFNLPADFPHGGISNVPGIMMKQAEATRGTPLAGLAVKVTTGYFLIGLSAVESDLARNVQLLKERAWFDVPVLYNDNRRAIIAIEKGNPGDRAFADAFAAWGTVGEVRAAYPRPDQPGQAFAGKSSGPARLGARRSSAVA